MRDTVCSPFSIIIFGSLQDWYDPSEGLPGKGTAHHIPLLQQRAKNLHLKHHDHRIFGGRDVVLLSGPHNPEAKALVEPFREIV